MLTTKFLLEKKCLFFLKINGFNNIKTSKISSGNIDFKTFYNDNKLILNYLKNKKNNNLYFSYVVFYLENYFSVFFRNFKMDNLRYNNLFLNNIFVKNKFALNIKILFYVIKTRILIKVQILEFKPLWDN